MSAIINLMQAMGYEDVNQGGVCFGLAHSLIQTDLMGTQNIRLWSS